MRLSRNKHNRNFPSRTKAQGGRLVTLTLDLGFTPFQREGGRAIIGDLFCDPMGLSGNKHNRNFPRGRRAQGGRLVTLILDLGFPLFQREGGRAIIGDLPGDNMGLSRNKHNRNFPGRTKAQGGRIATLTLDLGLRNCKGKAVELLLEISLAIPWE